jgi:hypothetical protein
VSNRPLVFVCGLTFGDYMLWNWSLNGNHDVLALLSGLTLPPLAVASVCLLAISLARIMVHSVPRARGLRSRRSSRPLAGRVRRALPSHPAVAGEHPGSAATPAATADAGAAGAPPASAGHSSGKLAA